MTASSDAGRNECKFRQMTVTRVYLRLRHTTSKIKDSSSAFCLNLSILNETASEKYPLFITYIIYMPSFLNHKYFAPSSDSSKADTLCNHWRSSHYAVTRLLNKNSNIQGMSPNVVK